ncbi:hypothetical protein [Halorussus halophilus]|uniref:hypothetical protein n=1 Tax=Halorussus halophilus TaxID=2650975 RepID=UPI0013012FA1|nr:hypothetical protein [Halorussus halophilus]
MTNDALRRSFLVDEDWLWHVTREGIDIGIFRWEIMAVVLDIPVLECVEDITTATALVVCGL